MVGEQYLANGRAAGRCAGQTSAGLDGRWILAASRGSGLRKMEPQTQQIGTFTWTSNELNGKEFNLSERPLSLESEGERQQWHLSDHLYLVVTLATHTHPLEAPFGHIIVSTSTSAPEAPFGCTFGQAH